MRQTETQEQNHRQKNMVNMAIATAVGQVGCLTLVVLLIAIFGGLWLDKYFGTRPWFTMGLLLASIPISLVSMFSIVRMATAKMQLESNPEKDDILEEEADFGKTS